MAAFDPGLFKSYSMGAFITHTASSDATAPIGHHAGPPSMPTAPSLLGGGRYENFIRPALATRNAAPAPIQPEGGRELRSGTQTWTPFSGRRVRSVSDGLLENIEATTGIALAKKDLLRDVEIDYELQKEEAAFLGLPPGRYFVGKSRIELPHQDPPDSQGEAHPPAPHGAADQAAAQGTEGGPAPDAGASDSESSSADAPDELADWYGPLLYHLPHASYAVHIQDLTRYSEKYGPPYDLCIEELLKHVGTPKEAVLLQTIHANCLLPQFVTVNNRAKLALHLAAASLRRTGCSSEMVQLVQLLATAEVRAYLRDHRLLAGAGEFWRSDWFNLASKLGPDTMNVRFAEVSTRRAETVKLTADYGPPLAARVKDIKYGNANALVEQAAVRLYALTGLHAPDANIAQRAQNLFGGFDANTRRDFSLHGDQPDRFCVIVSRLLPGFQDLGMMLLDPASMHELIDSPGDRARYDGLLAKHTRWTATYETLRNLPLDAQGQHPQPAELRQANAQRLGALQGMYELLPRAMQDDVATSYFVSGWLMNWDIANVGLANIGFYKEHGSGRLCCAAVDFGNSLVLGFGGRNKEDSWQTVGSARGLNDAARIDDPDPRPRTGRVNQLDPRWNGDLRYGPRQHASVPRRDQPGTVTVPVTTSFSAIGDLPRALPIAMLIRRQIEAETFAVGMDDGGWTTPSDATGRKPPVRPAQGDFKPLGEKRQAPYLERDFAPFIEGAYRLSLIPDEALQAMALQYWPWQGAETEGWTQQYCPRTSTDQPDHVELAARLAARRDQLVEQFDIQGWAERNPAKAQQAYAEVFASVLGLTNVVIAPAPWGVRDDTGQLLDPSAAGPARGEPDLVEHYGLDDPHSAGELLSTDEILAGFVSKKARERQRVMDRPDALERRLRLLNDQLLALVPALPRLRTVRAEMRSLVPGNGGAGASDPQGAGQLSDTDRQSRLQALRREEQTLLPATEDARREADHLYSTIGRVVAQWEEAKGARDALLAKEAKEAARAAPAQEDSDMED